jgi:hypothetical protein
MEAKPTLAVFPTDNDQGRDLAGRLLPLSEKIGFEARVRIGADQAEVTKACVFDDYVVFDGSVETGDNYAAATEIPKHVPWVFVVSRTYLPLNFHGFGDAPDAGEDIPAAGGAPRYPKHQSNEEILRWLEPRLVEAARGPRREKPAEFTTEAIHQVYATSPEPPTPDVFISYRGHLREEVKKPAERVNAGDFAALGVGSAQVFRPAPRAFHQTVLTALDRWAVLALISDKIYKAKEFWVYDSGDEYLQSWWTLGELVTRAAHHPEPILIRRYDPLRGQLDEPKPEHLLVLDEPLKRRISRLFVNSHPDMIGPESVEANRSWFNNFLLKAILWFKPDATLGDIGFEAFAQMTGAASSPFGGEVEWMKKEKLRDILESRRDFIYSKDFSERYIAQCSHCVDWSVLRDARSFLDVEALCTGKIPGFFTATLAQVQSGSIVCPVPGCRRRYDVEEIDPSHVWFATRMGGLLSKGRIDRRRMFRLIEPVTTPSPEVD